MVAWARKYGIKFMMHTGGTSLADDDLVVIVDDVLAVNPDVACHINGRLRGPSKGRLPSRTQKSLQREIRGRPKSLLRLRGKLGELLTKKALEALNISVEEARDRVDSTVKEPS